MADILERLNRQDRRRGSMPDTLAKDAAAEIERLKHGLLAAQYLLLAATGPEDGPTSWYETRKRWMDEFGVWNR